MEPTTTITDTPIPPTGGIDGTMTAAELAATEEWLDGLEAERVHPDAIGPRLRHAGWPDAAVAWAQSRYRRRFTTHPAIWWGGFSAIGFSALACAGVAHALIDGSRDTAAEWFGIMLVSLVFAGVAVWLISGVAGKWTQRFSASRRAAATTLFWGAIAVAVIRGVIYGQVLGHALLVGEDCDTTYEYSEVLERSTEITTCDDRTVDALAHLGLTAAAAGPVAAFAWYGHRKPTDAPVVESGPVTAGAA